MDFSSLPEAQKQQLQQLQQQFEEHQRQQQQAQAAQQQQQQIQQQQQQQQQQIQEYAASQAYDPTQVQSYDQSYYSYYQSQDPQQQQQQHQQYAYYPTDYGNAYQQQPQQQSSQIESASVYPPPGVSNEAQPQIVGSGGGAPAVQVQPQNVESGGGATTAQVQHQDAYYPQQVAAVAPAAQPPAGDQQVVAPVGPSEVNPAGAAVGPPGLNAAAAAAVAALSQLTQFAGTMDAAERAMAELQGLQWHGRGGGYGPMMGPGAGPGPYMGPELMHPPVGRFPFRGGGRRGGGPFRGGRAPKSGGSGSPSRGRGRGRGRGGPKRFPPHGASSSSNPEPDSESKEEEEEAEPSADNHETPVQGNAAPNLRPPQAIRCELCKIECNSLEILEQHKNGKKHKKNLQMSGYPVTEIQKPVSDPNAGVTLPPENVNQVDNLPSEAVNGENKVEIDQKNGEAGEPELPEEQSTIQEMKPSVNRFDNQRRGVKRKMRGGRGGKRLKTFDPPRRAVEPPKPKIVVPIVCDLCNVKCDTQEVFNIHLSGKKHISKLKRYEGHHAMYGPVGLQALYPPNPIAQTSYPQGPQQAYYGPQGPYPPPEAYMPPQAHYATPAETGFQQSHNPQVS